MLKERKYESWCVDRLSTPSGKSECEHEEFRKMEEKNFKPSRPFSSALFGLVLVSLCNP
jgi:hypothetical protein